MTRFSAEHKERTRRRIVEVSGRRLKSDGIAASGVATLMADAGLTNGAFYTHFASKDDLVVTVVREQLDAQRETVEAMSAEPDGVAAYVRAYLSPRHRDHPDDGCPSAALLDELSRGPAGVRQAWTDGVLAQMSVVARAMDPSDPASAGLQALEIFSGMVGTLQVARALTDRELSDELLERGAATALARLRSGST